MCASGTLLAESLEKGSLQVSTAPQRNAVTIDMAALERQRWIDHISRQRRQLAKQNFPSLPPAFFDRATSISFQLDGIDISEAEVAQARQNGDPARPNLRSRSVQRVRNHVAILLQIDSDIAHNRLLKTDAVLRWYTSVSSGLSTTMPAVQSLDRLNELIGRVNSPRMRLEPAVAEIGALYCQALRDELVPSFNGIMARLLLRYHLGRCNLPPVLMDAERDRRMQDLSSGAAELRLLELISQTYELILAT